MAIRGRRPLPGSTRLQTSNKLFSEELAFWTSATVQLDPSRRPGMVIVQSPKRRSRKAPMDLPRPITSRIKSAVVRRRLEQLLARVLSQLRAEALRQLARSRDSSGDAAPTAQELDARFEDAHLFCTRMVERYQRRVPERSSDDAWALEAHRRELHGGGGVKHVRLLLDAILQLREVARLVADPGLLKSPGVSASLRDQARGVRVVLARATGARRAWLRDRGLTI